MAVSVKEQMEIESKFLARARCMLMCMLRGNSQQMRSACQPAGRPRRGGWAIVRHGDSYVAERTLQLRRLVLPIMHPALRFGWGFGSKHLTRQLLADSHSLCFKRHYRERKRFYKNVSITQSGSKAFEINLDQRKLRTPSGQPLVIPTESLAVAVATEWDTQCEVIKQHSMHLTALCNTVLDNPTHRSKAQIITAMLHFLETDTLCYRLEDPPELVTLQDMKWEPMLDWINERYDVNITSTTSIAGPEIPQETYRTLQHHLETHSDWALVGYENAIQCLKSLVLTFALMDREITVEEAVSLSRLETEFQIGKWGSVEWAHDTEFADSKARVAAAVLFTHLVTEHTETIQKSRTH